MKDEILEEVWATKDRIAARYHGDIKKYMADLRKKQRRSPLRVAAPKTAGKPRKSA